MVDFPPGIGKVQWRSYTVEIVAFRFWQGGAHARARSKGPFEAYEGPCDIYGVDGFLVSAGGRISIPKVKPDEYLDIDLWINFNNSSC